MAELRAPLLVLWGEQDRVFDSSGAALLRERVPHAQVQLVPGVGHLPMMEAPDEAARAYDAFLKGLR